MKMASGSIELISKFVLHVQEGGIVVCAFQRFCFLCSCWLYFFTASLTTLLFFFLSKSPGGHAISFQIKPWVAFGFPYLLIELFYIGAPVVRAVRRSVGRTVTWQPKFLGCIGYQFSWPWCFATINSVQVINVKNTKQNAQVINVTDTK